MKSYPFLAILLAGSPVVAAVQRVGSHQFTLPDGFRIEQAASTNDVLRPVNGAIDDQGRLYVTDSSGSTEPPAAQHKDPQWRVIRLEDTDGDGRYDKSVVFADRLPMLQGILWHQGEVYIGGTPAIWKLKDTDGDGRADRREEWWNVGHPPTHCGNEVHGPYSGPDGFIYWTKGAFEPVSWTNGFTGKIHRDRAAHIFRARPDGSGMESMMTGGMDNPVEVVFTADGEILFNSTFIDFSQPGWRDGVAHASFGAVYGKVNDVLEERSVLRTGPALAHPFVQMGAAAPSGLAAYPGTEFGEDFSGDVFVSAFNLRKISRLKLRRSGASYAADETDFAVSDNLDFHPTDVITDSDGSLLILDTGGWYKLCCPSSQLWKADVLGGVYRVTKNGAKHKRSPAPPVAGQSTLASVRRLGDARDKQGAEQTSTLLANSLKSGALHEQLTAITAAAKLRLTSTVPDIFAALAASDDETLRMAATAALIEIGDASSVRQAMSRNQSRTAAAALYALDQIDGGSLGAVEVAPLLFSTEVKIRDAANWVASRHPDWGDALANHVRAQLDSGTRPAGGSESLSRLFSTMMRSDAIRTLAAGLAVSGTAHEETRLAALRAMAAARLKTPPETWPAAVAKVLADSTPQNTAMLTTAIKTAGSFNSTPAVADALLSVARNTRLDLSHRVEAYAALPAGWVPGENDISVLSKAVASRQSAAAEALSRTRLEAAQAATLLSLFREAGPLELTRLVPAFEKTPDSKTGDAFVTALSSAKSRAAIRPDLLRAVLKAYPDEVKARGEKLLESLDTSHADKKTRLEKIRAELPEGDIRRGQSVFNSAKAACIQCHQLGYQGGDVGPDLTAIGTVRSAEDLLEAIVYPSASFVRSYEPMTVKTKDDEERTGILKRDDERGVTLVTGPNAVLTLNREDVVEVTPSTVSVMPAGLEEQLSRQELADLLAFLKNTKWGKN